MQNNAFKLAAIDTEIELLEYADVTLNKLYKLMPRSYRKLIVKLFSAVRDDLHELYCASVENKL